MEPRFDLRSNSIVTSFSKRLVTASRVVEDSGLPAATCELIRIRASQINGCSF